MRNERLEKYIYGIQKAELLYYITTGYYIGQNSRSELCVEVSVKAEKAKSSERDNAQWEFMMIQAVDDNNYILRAQKPSQLLRERGKPQSPYENMNSSV